MFGFQMKSIKCLFRFISNRANMTTNARDVDLNYKKAVSQLNALQSNAQTIIQMRDKRQEMINMNLKETRFYLEALGITDDKLDKLNAIHVSGTKGKGSTCAFTESLLRGFGLKTGFYSSPHLVHVRERIRIDGVPISQELFAQRFFEVYDKVHSASVESNVPMPAYFKFLTLMAFHSFLQEKVDVMIIEVGIGGEHDCTNVLRKPVVCGITTLDIDHTSLLGLTIPEIAWHKAGIMKEGTPCFTVSQTPETWKVFEVRAREKSTRINECKSFELYEWSLNALNEIKTYGKHQRLNIALALQLVNMWCSKIMPMYILGNQNFNGHLEIPPNVEKSILSTHWPGRNHLLKTKNIDYYLDGAHTQKSIQCCVDWFNFMLDKNLDKNPNNEINILLFHCTADRDPSTLLSIIAKTYAFQFAIFCPTKLFPSVDLSDDNTNINQSANEQWRKCLKTQKIWTSLHQKNGETYRCIKNALDRIHEIASNNPNINVLVTGSLHLVGGVLNFEDPQAAL